MGRYALLSPDGFLGAFLEAFDPAKIKGWGMPLCLETKSTHASETYPYLGGSPRMRKWQGSRKPRAIPSFKYVVQNEPWESTLPVQKEELRRDNWGALRRRIAGMGVKAARNTEVQVSLLLEANGLCYDGKAFYATNHGESGSDQTNIVTRAVVNKDAPTASEMASVIGEMIEVQYGYLDSESDPVNEDATEFQLQYPKNWRGVISTLFNVESPIATSAAFLSNPAKSHNVVIRPVMNPRLTATDACHLLRTDDENNKPLVKQMETEFEPEVLGDGSDVAFFDRTILYGISYWGNFGYYLWQHATKGVLTNA